MKLSLARLNQDNVHIVYAHGPTLDELRGDELQHSLCSIMDLGLTDRVGISVKRSGVTDQLYIESISKKAIKMHYIILLTCQTQH